MKHHVADSNAACRLADASPQRHANEYLTRSLSGPHRDLLELAAGGAPIGEALNAVVRAVGQVRTQETRAAIFIFDPAGARLRFAAAEGLDEDYTGKIDNFPVGPGQPSCGKAAYVGTDIIVGDVASDAAWAPFLELAQRNGIRACWSFLLRDAAARVIGTFALYHRVPCEPDAADYEEVRYFVNIASLMIERHLAAEQRRQEQALVEENLRASNRHKDAFLATLAHELRNPLGAISHGLAIIRLAGEQAAPRERALERTDRQIRHMECLIEDLLDANRLTRGELTLRRQRIALGPALELAVETVTPLCAAKGQQLAVRLPREPVHIDADPVRVTQMVTNLLNNACKFTGRGGAIFLDVEAGEHDVTIRVRDQGVGIAAHDIDTVFDLFAQVGGGDGAGGVNKGLGIGLTLVRKLADMHGGSVHAVSDGPGHGAEFTLRLPLA